MGKLVGMGYRPKKNKNIEKENKEKDNEISTLISEKEDLIKKVSELEKKNKKSE